jgi:hypothetical protein
MEPISCGGRHRTTQEREQWASGCNFVALRQGGDVAIERGAVGDGIRRQPAGRDWAKPDSERVPRVQIREASDGLRRRGMPRAEKGSGQNPVAQWRGRGRGLVNRFLPKDVGGSAHPRLLPRRPALRALRDARS